MRFPVPMPNSFGEDTQHLEKYLDNLALKVELKPITETGQDGIKQYQYMIIVTNHNYQMSKPFYVGLGCFDHLKVPKHFRIDEKATAYAKVEYNAINAFYCLVSDALAYIQNEDAEAFGDAFGYEVNSWADIRKIEGVYHACEDIYNELTFVMDLPQKKAETCEEFFCELANFLSEDFG